MPGGQAPAELDTAIVEQIDECVQENCHVTGRLAFSMMDAGVQRLPASRMNLPRESSRVLLDYHLEIDKGYYSWSHF